MGRTEGPLHTQRSHCYQSRHSMSQQSRLRVTHSWWNFRETSSKAGWEPLWGLSMCLCEQGRPRFHVTPWPLEQGAGCRTHGCVVCLLGPELPLQRSTQTETHAWLTNDPWEDTLLAEIITVSSFTGPFVWRVSGNTGMHVQIV